MSELVSTKTILVTGAGSGIGRAIVQLLGTNGAHVYGADLDIDSVTKTCSVPNTTPLLLDVADQDSWTRALSGIEVLDGLVNCAGIDVPEDTILGCSEKNWERMMRVNLDGVFLGTKAAVAKMRESGTGGSIVNLASVLSIIGSGETLSYGTSKAAVGGLTRSVALETAALGIRCNTVHPGYIRTPMTDRWDGDAQSAESETAKLHPLGRIGEPDEVARLVMYLLSDESSYVSGSQLTVDGGYLAI